MSLFEQQQKRRAALVERLGMVADLACQTPFPGDLGDVAYDLLREAAAQIASDRLHFERLAASPANHAGDLPDRFEAWWATYRHRNRDQVGYAMKKQIGFDAFAAATHAGSVGEALERARHKLGHVSIDAMEGDNLAVTLCSHFDDGEGEEDECGWTKAAVEGCDATLDAIHAVYVAALHPIDSRAAQEKGV